MNVEIGLVFSKDFIVEKQGSFSFYADTTGETIVRYEASSVHGNTHLKVGSPLIITPISKGDLKVRTFVKAENVESVYRNLNFAVK